jgi:hypothetical protein
VRTAAAWHRRGDFTDYTHDLAGRVTASTLTTAGVEDAQTFGYTYYVSDVPATGTYPSFRPVTTCPDGNLQPL